MKNIITRDVSKRFIVVSICCNATLLLAAGYCYMALYYRSTTIVVEEAVFRQNAAQVYSSVPHLFINDLSNIVEEYMSLSTHDLLTLLQHPEEDIAYGFTNIDVALSILHSRQVTIDIPLKALGRWPQEMTTVSVHTKDNAIQEFACFCALSAADLAAIQTYLASERAPYTSKLLFKRIQESQGTDEVYRSAFEKTEQWYYLSRLLQPLFFSKDTLFSYISMLSWQGVEEHIIAAQKRDQMQENSCYQQKTEAEFTSHYLQTILQLIAHDFMRTKSRQLAECIIAICPIEHLKKGSIDLLRGLFQSLEQDDQIYGIRLALEIAKGPCKENQLLIAKEYLSHITGHSEIVFLSRKEFCNVCCAFEKTTVNNFKLHNTKQHLLPGREKQNSDISYTVKEEILTSFANERTKIFPEIVDKSSSIVAEKMAIGKNEFENNKFQSNKKEQRSLPQTEQLHSDSTINSMPLSHIKMPPDKATASTYKRQNVGMANKETPSSICSSTHTRSPAAATATTTTTTTTTATQSQKNTNSTNRRAAALSNNKSPTKCQSVQDKEGAYVIYTVRKGDSLWSISKRFGVSINEICNLNKIKGTTLPPGLVLTIPKNRN